MRLTSESCAVVTEFRHKAGGRRIVARSFRASLCAARCVRLMNCARGAACACNSNRRLRIKGTILPSDDEGEEGEEGEVG